MKKTKKKIAVCGAGGFIGGHLVKRLLEEGHEVTAVDIKPFCEWYQEFKFCHKIELDLNDKRNCFEAIRGCDEVYNLAANMGGMGFIEVNKGLCMLTLQINTNLLIAAASLDVARFFFASSACVYAADKQTKTDCVALKEEDAYPASPEDGYGWEKLISERMCRHFWEDFGLSTRVARFHNVYGTHGTFDGGREKAPAAICRKIIQANQNGERSVEIWGDGNQTRSFMFVDDCIDGILKIMKSDIEEPINLGSSEMVSINQLFEIVSGISKSMIPKHHKLDAPKGVRGRSSDNTKIKKLLNWEPTIPLIEGIRKTYNWIKQEIEND